MPIVLKDRVKETAAAPGTGTITLGGAASGFQTFSAIGNGNVTYFAIVDSTSGAWEVNYGTYTTSGTTLTRNATPLSSSNAGALVNFTGAVEVFCTYPSEKAIYEETGGNVLIDGGPITVIGTGVTSYTTFSAALGELYANIDSFAQIYAQNLNDGTEASSDFVAYNDLGDGTNNFVDMGINSSNYTSATYPIFTPGSAYVFNDGGEMIIGSATDDLLLFAGGVATTDWAVRIDKTSKLLTTKAGLDVGGALDVTGAATFGSTVLLDADPTLALQAATKQYVDNATANGFHVHTPVLVATTGNLTATYNQPGGAGVGVGATLTNSGTQVALEIDGVAMTVADRVLVWQQSTGFQNGIYTVTTVGDGSTNWVLTRATDADEAGEGSPDSLGGGDYFFVQSGDTQGFFAFVCTNTSTISFGTTAITFNEFSQVPVYTGTAPINVSGQTIALTGTVAATNGGTGTNTVTTGDLLYGSATNTWSKLAAGAGYKSLVMNSGGTNVEWNAVALNQSAAVSGSLGPTNGGTGQSGYTLGDTLYSSAADTLAKLAGNTTTTKKFMVQTGTGAVSAAPEWGTINGADVSGNISGQAGSVANALTAGTYLTSAGTYNGAAARTFAVDATSANTADKVVARDASGNFSAGTITATLSGSATSATTATNLAGGAANQLAYQSGSGATTFAVAPSASNQVLNWNGSAFTWSAGTISGVALGSNLNSLTAGTYLTGTAYNGSGAQTWTVDATSANTASKVVARDASGNFSAGTITASLSGNATSATNATSAANLTGGVAGAVPYQSGASTTSFSAAGSSGQYLQSNGTAAPSWITPPTIGNGTLTMNVSGTGLSGTQTFTANQAGNATFTVTSNATNLNTGSTIVARDVSGNFNAGTITASLNGNASTATSATSATTATNLAGGSAGTVPYQSAAGTTVQLAAGSSGQFLRSNGAAPPSWATVSASPAGSNTQIQYNNAGAFGGSSFFTYNGTKLTVRGIDLTPGNIFSSACTGVGNSALASLGTSPIGDTAVGYAAAYSLTTGIYNTAVGYQAMFSNQDGFYNVAVGADALLNGVSAGYSTAVGYQALNNSTGTENVGVGYRAGFAQTSGSNNSFFGPYAGQSLTTASNNTMLGAFAGNTAITGTNNTCVGFNAQTAATTSTNSITLGNSNIGTLRCAVTTITSLSDERDKTDVQPLTEGLRLLREVAPVRFTWNTRDEAKVGHPDTGFIAQQLQQAQVAANADVPGLVFDENPDKLEAGYGKLLPFAISAIKQLDATVEELRTQLAELKAELNTLKGI